ncbi:hypothetical protein M8J77_017328 [Diaphorina citri]|nr:hypothetical protein M8J77_017328 [Diaphorina citri]
MKTKLKIYETTVLSSLLYSSETWTLLEEHIKQLDRFHQRCLRSILKIKWNDFVPNEEVLKKAQVMSIDNIIRIRRLRWAGHVSRMEPNRTPMQIAFAELTQGKRERQKPKCRWMDTVKNDLNKLGVDSSNWRNLAGNRNQWRENTIRKIEAYQETTIKEKETKRANRHSEEEKNTWQCPLCSFSREGRHGRRYVISHMTQKHGQQTPTETERETQTKCNMCDLTCKSKSGLQSHMRSKHPLTHQPLTRQPIKIMPHASSQSQGSQQIPPTSSNQQPPTLPSQQSPTPLIQPITQSILHQCKACQRICRTRAGLTSHQRNVTCRAVIEEMESSDTMDT